MKKIIVLSVDENPKYLFTLPLVVWSWMKIGWSPLILMNLKPSVLDFLVGRTISEFKGETKGVIIENIPGYRPETIAQVSRLYAAAFTGEDTYVMTGDADMMALASYWNPKDNDEITIWGRDLATPQIPICYVGMKTKIWREVMNIRSSEIQWMMRRDLEMIGGAKEDDEQVNRWCADQRIITDRIDHSNRTKLFIERGSLPNGYAKGRIDRSAWNDKTQDVIDCHLPHDIYTNGDSFAKVFKMLMQLFPNDNHDWFIEYTKQFSALTK